LLLAEVYKRELDLAGDLFIHLAGDANAAGLRELRKNPVAGGVDDAAAVFGDHGKYDGLMLLETANRVGFVRTHEGAVSSDVGRKNCCQPAEDLSLL